MVLFFLFSSSADHRYLHSFPTRRSSDLEMVEAGGLAFLSGIVGVDDAGEPVQSARARSEEHTSELQSLRHLVCRLLLEKKKTTIQRIPRFDARGRSDRRILL